MRVLVVAEGKHELSTEHAAYAGALCQLIQRIIPRSDCHSRGITDLNKRLHGSSVRGRHEAYEKRALLWLKEATEQKFDALVLLVDEDGHKDRIRGFDAAQRSVRWTIPRAMGVAIRTFDAWMLADETALSRVMGVTIQRQPDPELLKKPKDKFRMLIEGQSCDQSELYSRIASELSIERLVDRCSTGFAPFHNRLLQLAKV